VGRGPLPAQFPSQQDLLSFFFPLPLEPCPQSKILFEYGLKLSLFSACYYFLMSVVMISSKIAV
jgi:hypothetical protein